MSSLSGRLTTRCATSPKGARIRRVAFHDAPEDDEPVTAADGEVLAEVQADRAAGVPRISFAEMKPEHRSP